ncbi:MAG: rhodanese-like domain-containing protein [Acidimicrobiia bacterium]|nr:rhodanese-like domain-containing protein [Acidimicrobiia bacterium]
MTRRILALALAASLATVACGGTDTAIEPKLETVTASAFAGIVDTAQADLVILDVRTPDEFVAGHIPGAVNVDYYEPSFRNDLDALDKDVPYALYCRSGNRSGDTLATMRDLGFTNVSELGGGIITWLEAGYPIEG